MLSKARASGVSLSCFVWTEEQISWKAWKAQAGRTGKRWGRVWGLSGGRVSDVGFDLTGSVVA